MRNSKYKIQSKTINGLSQCIELSNQSINKILSAGKQKKKSIKGKNTNATHQNKTKA